MTASASKRKFFTILGGGLLFTIGLAGGILVPLVRSINTSYTTRLESRRELFSLEEKERRLKDLEHTIAETEADIRAIRRMFFDPKEVLTFVEALEAYAHTSGVDLDVATARVATEPGIRPSDFSLQALGSFAGVHHLLQLLTNSPYALTISSIDMRTGTGSDTAIEANILVSVMTQK